MACDTLQIQTTVEHGLLLCALRSVVLGALLVIATALAIALGKGVRR